MGMIEAGIMNNEGRELFVLRDPPARASWNMALDESLLEDPTSCWLRFYAWEPHAISLGYFQKIGDFALEAERFDLVRRPTGGGAILHAHELTFSLALPEALLPSSVRSSYSLINGALMEALRDLGVGLREPTDCDSTAGTWCFAHPVGLDLVQKDGRKVVGCAQRRRQGRVLHHGSLVLERHPHTDFTGSLADCGLQKPYALVDGLRDRLGEVLNLDLREVDTVPPPILVRARELEQQRYASADWTNRR